VTLFDDRLVTINDLGSNFYAKESHVGKVTRAEASLSELKDLNPNATIEIAKSTDI
jgi:molybdopterin/thiamine biosynthesis adenylyltransferase